MTKGMPAERMPLWKAMWEKPDRIPSAQLPKLRGLYFAEISDSVRKLLQSPKPDWKAIVELTSHAEIVRGDDYVLDNKFLTVVKAEAEVETAART